METAPTTATNWSTQAMADQMRLSRATGVIQLTLVARGRGRAVAREVPASGRCSVSDHPAPPRDPCSILRARRDAKRTTEAADHVEELLQLQGAWLLRRVRAVADRFRLHPDDLYQEVMLRMLRSSVTVDAQNRGVRTWLSRLIENAAVDMIRVAKREVPVEAVDLDALDQIDVDQCWPERQAGFELAVDVYHLVERCGLRLHEARAVALRCSGVDMTFKEYAALVGRSHAAVRKDYERGMRKIQVSLGLSSDEHEIMRAMVRHGSPAAVARVLGYPEDDVADIAARAAKKINQLFEGQEGCR